MRKYPVLAVVSAAILFFLASPAFSHFGMVIPSDSMVMQGEKQTVRVQLSFSHPMEGVGMTLVKPKAVGVSAAGTREDLLSRLKAAKIMGEGAWEFDYPVKRPGVYTFYIEPEPYWEPAEDCFLVHLTKTVVAAFGDEEGWDEELGLKTEIVPLSRPFGNYAGNLFQGIVKMDGKPVPYSTVEVEYYNQTGKYQAPTDYMVTQTVKADGNGVFSYAVPKAGWWGFAALNPSDAKMKKDGVEKEVEMGAVIWVEFVDMKKKP